jgi:hypothetical protein
MNAKTICPTAEVQRTPVGSPHYCRGVVQLRFPLLVEHSQISGSRGQRLASVIIDHCRTICQELVPRGTRPAYFCLLVPRVQATVSHNDKED